MRHLGSVVLSLAIGACSATPSPPPDAGSVDSSSASDSAAPDTGVPCDDGIACTTDAPWMGGCRHTVNDAQCASGETCDLDLGCI